MKEYYQLIKELDNLPDNMAREKYLMDIKQNPLIPRHDLRRIACNILLESKFIETNYPTEIKNRIRKVIAYFMKISKK
ncbi:hypothetical protein [Chryseobacterium sp. CT-SW4]|uniref:hypothetical protein n=1 Tax=Chryseobacterium sp. SW-1 TaxID=3157343 RepID=UPI003B01BA4C